MEKDRRTIKFYPMPGASSRFDVVILADGSYPEGDLARAVLHGAERVVCCDGAADAYVADRGEPAAIVGDCDSVSREVRERFGDVVHCIEEQQTNDLTKAFEYCAGMGWTGVAILGATGKREDHTIANISLLADYAVRADVVMITDHGVFNAATGECRFGSYAGQQVSVFSLSPDKEIRYGGLVYRLQGDKAGSWWQGSLNCSTGGSFTVSSDGRIIVFRAI